MNRYAKIHHAVEGVCVTLAFLTLIAWAVSPLFWAQAFLVWGGLCLVMGISNAALLYAEPEPAPLVLVKRRRS